jgi:RimJ/RimL family protein N-acetyltransferase
MKLEPIDSAERIELVAGWLGEKANYQWLDFGNGIQVLTPVMLKVMTQKDTHLLRIFTSDEEEIPIGVIGLSNVDHRFKTAMIWVALGDKRHSGRGYPFRAASQLLTLGFKELGLHAVNAWAVEHNVASLRIIKRLHFQYIGRQRQCHSIDGRSYDRLLFDLLASEHKQATA